MKARKRLELKIQSEERELEALLGDIAQAEKLVGAARQNIEGLRRVLEEMPAAGNGNGNGITAKEIAPLVVSLLKQAGAAGTTREIVCAHLKKYFEEKDPERLLTGIAVQADRALGSEGVEELEGGRFRLKSAVAMRA